MNGKVYTHINCTASQSKKGIFLYNFFCIKWKPEIIARMTSRYILIEQRLKKRSALYMLLVKNLLHIHKQHLFSQRKKCLGII